MAEDDRHDERTDDVNDNSRSKNDHPDNMQEDHSNLEDDSKETKRSDKTTFFY